MQDDALVYLPLRMVPIEASRTEAAWVWNPVRNWGRSRITGLLGKGGMGEVYAARDRKLGRDVAIKILPEYFAADAERLARFAREAQTLAALNHPNIATVHGFEHDEERGLHYLVMEHIDGETLGEVIFAGPLLVPALLPIFIDIARGLDAAHEAGIVHRDLKPDNVKINASGVIKILDFGLAKGNTKTQPTTPDAPTTPINPLAVTAEGTFLGTPSYMSPEQAQGKEVDRRTDIWAFGCCLYQAMTGDVPFKGDTIADIVGSILKTDPDWSKLPEDMPESVQNLLRRCLEKEPRRRLSSAGDIAITLEEAQAALKRGPGSSAGLATRKPRSHLFTWGPVMAACVGIGLLAWYLLLSSPGDSLNTAGFEQDALPELKPVQRFAMKLPSHLPLASPQVADTPLTLSPDGTMLAYCSHLASGGEGLVLQRIGELDAQVLVKMGHVDRPSFSPDGQWIACVGLDDNGWHLMKVPVSGGPPITLADVPLNFPWPAWTDDGHIVYGVNFGEGLMRVPVTGGEPEVVTTVENDHTSHACPVVLPGGHGIIYGRFTEPVVEAMQIMVLDPRTNETRALLDGAAPMFYLPTGHLVYVQVGRIMAAPFDVNTLTFTGPAFDITEMSLLDPEQAPTRVAVSGSGTFAYVPSEQSATEALALVWLDLKGKRTPLDLPPDYYGGGTISPDGRKLAISIRHSNNKDVWIIDLERGTRTRFTDKPGGDVRPVWTPDGSHIVFLSDRGGRWGLYRKAVDGKSPVEKLIESPDEVMYASWIAPDNKALIFQRSGDVYLLQLDEDKTVRPLLNSRFGEGSASVSPDGKWIAYQSNESGRAEVYVQSFPDLESRVQVSTNGGRSPHWIQDTNRLRFVQDEPSPQLFEVELQFEPNVTVSNPKLVLTIERPIVGGTVDPDGERYLTWETLGDPTLRVGGTEVVVVQNWFQHVKQLEPFPDMN